jgi:hypothetical protein
MNARAYPFYLLLIALLGSGFWFALQGDGGEASSQPLPALNADIKETSVSGISSGAYMAGQFQFAHSDIVSGAAIIAGGPYGCSESLYADVMPGPGTSLLNLNKAMNGCMLDGLALWGIPNPPGLAEKAKRRAAANKIGPIDAVLTDRVYLFSGKEDRTVVPAIVQSAYEFYQALGMKPEQIKSVTTYPAGHAIVTEDEGARCEITQKPFVVDCDYDQAGDLLSHLRGELKPRVPQPTGQYIVFDQEPFTEGMLNHGLSSEGVAYVPQSCRGGGCKVHVAFHGCAQNRESVGETFVQSSGFARWADSNKLIVLYPQIATTPFNVQGCWDWWGYTGREYLTRDAPQARAVRRMLDRLQQPASAS